MSGFRTKSLFFSLFFVFARAEGSNLDAQRDFDRAIELSRAGSEKQALVSLTDFLRRYPQHPKAVEVQFEIAEIYFHQRQFAEARKEFEKVYRYQGTVLAAEIVAKSGLRLGECSIKIGKIEEARIEWEAVLRKYPKTEAAKTAQLHLAGLAALEATQR